MKAAVAVTAAIGLGLAPAADGALYLTKPEAQTQAKAFARYVCTSVFDQCDRSAVESSSRCERLSARQVDCDATFYEEGGRTCFGAIRVTEYPTRYNRRPANPDGLKCDG